MSRFLVDVENATVCLKQNPVLKNITWRHRPGENWALIGNNGSGKTTLLKLIFGELLPVEGGRVSWFGSRVWNGLSEIRQRTALVSAEFQQTYDQNLTALEVVVSGFFDSIGLWEKATAAQTKQAREMMRFLGIAPLARQRFFSLSYGERRRVLLARALVFEPDLLVLDEPCTGLDIPTRERFLDSLQKLTATRTRMIYVTHHVEELLPAISHVLYLKKGETLAQGPKKDMLTDKIISKALGCRIRLTEQDGRYWVSGCR
ncbi:MAG: ATP-binding cassette domain-containing protein [Nitrospina sp.]|nr:ATP-binding cassette domain-containing protein [Nitrospina sp.]